MTVTFKFPKNIAHTKTKCDGFVETKSIDISELTICNTKQRLNLITFSRNDQIQIKKKKRLSTKH